MSHHGSGPFDGPDDEAKKAFKAATERNERIRNLLDTTGFRGALGEFPEGQMTKTDEGAIQFVVARTATRWSWTSAPQFIGSECPLSKLPTSRHRCLPKPAMWVDVTARLSR